MNKEVIYKQVINMAELCGFSRTHHGDVELWMCNKNDLENFAQYVAKEVREYMVFQATPSEWMMEHVLSEREACAKICDEEVAEWKYDADVVDVAIAIRARGNK